MMKGEMNELVRQLMEDVARKSKGDADLAIKIAPKLGRRYSNLAGSIANWRNLHDRMPAEALLAACQVAGISVDEVLFGRSLRERQDRLEEELGKLRKSIESQRVTLLQQEDVQPPDLR